MRDGRPYSRLKDPVTIAQLAAGLTVVFFGVSLLSGARTGLTGQMALMVEGATAAVAYLVTARRAGRTRKALFGALAAAAVLALVGRAWWAAQELITGSRPVVPIFEVYARIAAQICLMAGLLFTLRGQRLRLRSEPTLDALVLVVAASIVAVQLPYVPSAELATQHVRIASLIWNVLGAGNLIFLALLLAWRGDLLGTRMSLGLAIGLVSLSVADMLYSSGTLVSAGGLSASIASLWSVANLCFLTAAQVPRGREPDLSAEVPAFESSAGKVRVVSIVVAILIASSSPLVMHFQRQTALPLVVAVAVFGAVLAARAGYALWTQQRATAALESTVVAEREMAVTLEHRVAIRTHELADAQRVLQRMWTLAQQISLDLRQEHVLQRFVEAAVDVVQTDAGAVGILNGKSEIQIAAHIGLDTAAGGRRIPVEGTAIGSVVTSGDVWWDEDVRHRRMPEAELARDGLGRGMAIVPLQRRGERLGAIVLVSHQRRRFTDEELSHVEAMTDLLSMALANVDLVDSLRKTEWRFRTLFRVAPDAVLTVLQSGRIKEANDAARDITGLAPSQLVGRTLDDLVVAEDQERVRSELTQALGGAPSRIEVRFRNEGVNRLVSLAIRLLPEADPPTVLFLGRDVTADREMRARLEETERLAAVGELVAGVAHEVNNPLSTISAFAQLMQRDTSLTVEQRDSIDIIHSETVRAGHVLKDLLTFARRSEGDRHSVDVNELVERTVRLRTYEMTANGVRASLELESWLPPVSGDARQIQQVLLNLVANAIQAMAPSGGGKLSIATRLEEDRVVMDVADTGPGIPADVRARVFEPFFTTKPEGTGLGLSVSYGIVTAHGGSISIENTSSAGATFRVTLPIAQEMMLDAQPTSAIALERSPLRGTRVLFVDDEPSLRNGMSAFGRLRQFTVVTAADGQTALAAIRRDAFDAIVCDLWMPGMDGPAFYEVLRREHGALAGRTVFITGDLVNATNQRFLRTTKQPVLGKPFEFEQLEEMVASLVNGRTLTAAITD